MPESDPASKPEEREVVDAVEAAHRAFRTVTTFSQEKIDDICEAMARVALAESARLGLLAHEETGFGRRMTSGKRTVSRPRTCGITLEGCGRSAS